MARSRPRENLRSEDFPLAMARVKRSVRDSNDIILRCLMKSIFNPRAIAVVVLCWGLWAAAMCWNAALAAGPPGVADVIEQTQPKIVKIFGAGGFRGLEAYQSGMLISSDGYILTVWSYVLDTDYITVVLNDGRKFVAKMLGADPQPEVAILKIDATDLPHFDLDKAVRVEPGDRILAFSNAFGVAQGNEPASVQEGVVSVITNLAARRGVFDTAYRGPVYVLDAVVNNPGSPGGALVTRRGELVGMLGKELRNALNNTWLNYALPIEQLRRSIDDIRAGKFSVRQEEQPAKKPAKSVRLAALGIVLVPDVLERTPPYVDSVVADSPAAKAGLQPDDLIVLVGDTLVQSCKALNTELEYIDAADPVRLSVIRGQQLIELTVQPAEEK